MSKKKCLIVTGGGDCPGLNAVIRSIVRCAHFSKKWEIWGSMRAFNGILESPQHLVKLTKNKVSGIHIRGGTILETTNKGDPFSFPVKDKEGNWQLKDRSAELISAIRTAKFEAVINIGGDGSQKISQKLYEKGLPMIGIPKTIDNDLSATEFTFGFQSAVDVATEAVDKLVSTAQSHNRVMIAEVMGRDAGWICLNAAVAAGAHVALIPEIPYDINSVLRHLKTRIKKGRGFANIVIAEGAHPKEGT
ncbi:MAG: 6-phosphofructokinase, partial [Candidatus Marinamargulisbacteria bacterium]